MSLHFSWTTAALIKSSYQMELFTQDIVRFEIGSYLQAVLLELPLDYMQVWIQIHASLAYHHCLLQICRLLIKIISQATSLASTVIRHIAKAEVAQSIVVESRYVQ